SLAKGHDRRNPFIGINEKQIQIPLQLQMLKAVIENNDFGAGRFGVSCSPDSPFITDHDSLRQFAGIKLRFISASMNILYDRPSVTDKHKTRAFSFIAAKYYSRFFTEYLMAIFGKIQ